ncbi:transcription initiation factor subunit [Aspergillus luchuensis]|uniref:Transcription initiation factor subunit n=1 Tax=Aspergillus kawachii TaxID=1069201 RepID=A0A146F575_ASPKA|nr:transcription initiation factor subunit [Aspergillus luchuensis]
MAVRCALGLLHGYLRREWHKGRSLKRGKSLFADLVRVFASTGIKTPALKDSPSDHAFKNPPFRISEEGWGEFDMQIGLTAADKEHFVTHDLNFAQPRYGSKHVITFKNPKPALLSLLRESGPVPGDENGVKSKRAATGEEGSKKKKRTEKSVDMDKLADGLQRLGEDDLLQVVQMVHDNKAPDSYTKNDVEQGEFHVDLYTLPDTLIKMLWDFTQEKGAL